MHELKLTIFDSGGGMGGLLLGLCMKKYASNVEFDIYESATQLTEVGAGVGVPPRIWTILKELGLEERLLEIAGPAGDAGMLSECYV